MEGGGRVKTGACSISICFQCSAVNLEFAARTYIYIDCLCLMAMATPFPDLFYKRLTKVKK